MWIIWLLIVLIVFFIVSAFFCVRTMTLPHVWDKEHEFTVLPEWGHDIRPFYDSVKPEPFEFESSRGYTLRGEVIPPPEGTAFPDGRPRVIMLVHGYTCNRYTMLSYGEIYHDLGFTLVTYDHRFHGVSGGDFCSMGYFESRDAVELAEYMKSRFPADTVWGIQGESMGSATTMLAAPQLPWISFVVEDCGYTTLHDEISASLKFKAHLPSHPISEVSCLVFKLWRGISVRDVRPIDAVAHIPQPMLFVHGGLDKFVPTKMVYKLFEQKPGDNKELKIFGDVPHAKSSLMHFEEYGELLKGFLEKYGII